MFIKNFILIISLFLFTAVNLFAQENPHWEFVGWEGGGCFPNLEWDPLVKDRVYLTSDVAGIWRSDDLGENWHFATQGLKNLLVAAIAVAPSDSNMLYAATAGGIYVSRDAGASWSETDNAHKQIKFQRPKNYRPIAISSKDPLNLCIATQSGEDFCSTDGGEHWQKLGLGQQENLTVIYFDHDEKNILTGGTSGFQKYDLKEQKWSEINGDLKGLTDIIVSKSEAKNLYAAANGDLWISDDEGVSWKKTTGKHEGKIFRLAVVEDGTIKIFAAVNQGWKGKILVSKDFGATWNTEVEKITPDKQADPTRMWAGLSGKIASLKKDPFAKNVLFRTDWWGIFRSDDGGVTWTEKIRGAPNSVGSDIVVTADSILVSTMDNGLLKSFDEGQSYHALFPSFQYDPQKAGHVWRVIVPAENRIVATSSPWSESINQVIVSEDGGVNFKIVADGLPGRRPIKNTLWGQGYPRALTYDPQNPMQIYLGIDGDDGGGLYISEDGGYSWGRSAGQPEGLQIYNALAVDPTDTQRIFWGSVGKHGGVYVSSDRGKTWERIFKQMSSVFDLAIAPEGTIFAAGNIAGPAVFVSHDHGQTWRKSISFTSNAAADALAIDPTNGKRIAFSTVFWSMGAPGKVYFSSDGGKEWSDITADLPPGSGAAAAIFSPDGKYLYITLYSGSVYRCKIN